MRKYRFLPTTDYRAALEQTGDVQVGARARRILWRRFAVSLVGLAMIAVAVAVSSTLLGSSKPADATHAIDVRCETCGNEFTLTASPDLVFPVACPKCKERAAKELWACRQCGNRFIPPDIQNDPSCPKCKSRNIGSAAAARRAAADSAGAERP